MFVKYEVDVKAIKEIMGGLEMSNIAFSALLGINRNTLRTYFNHPEKMPYEVIVKMAEILNVPDEKIKCIFFKEKLAKT